MTERQKHPLLTLFLLTLIAGVLRFSWIDKPAIWGDEAQTWRRICGSFQQMVDELHVAGFMPGNYLLTWWIKDGFPISGEFKEGPPAQISDPFLRGREPLSTKPRLVFTPTLRLNEDGFEPTPRIMRLLPALCGTLMVPAMYFLASRLVARRTALLVAVFTCFSAYLLNYSRDAKMYMQFWFFAALHVGCLLWWLEAYRKREKPPEPPHLADDNVVEGVRSILPDKHIARIGDAFAVRSAPDRVRSTEYPSRLETTVRWMCWLTSGLAMIAFNAVGLGIVGIEVLIFLATMPLRTHWIIRVVRWTLAKLPRRRKVTENQGIPTPTTAPARCVVSPSEPHPFRFVLPPVIGFALGCAAVVCLWYSYKEFTRFYDRVNPRDEIARMDLNDAGISWVEPYNDGRTAGGYFLYNATAYLMNWEWVKPDELSDVDPRALKLLRYSAASLLIAIGVGVVPWRKLIGKRPAKVSRLRGTLPLTAGFIVACWLLLPAYGFYCASGSWTDNGRRMNAIAPTQFLLKSVFPASANDGTRNLAGALGAQLSNARTARGWAEYHWGQLFVVHGLGDAPVRWWVLGMLAGIGLLVILDRWHTWREKTFLSFRVIGLFALFWLLALLVYVFTPIQGGSIWMPRYLGFIWPAFAISICVLIRRLPFAPVRWLVVAALIGTNLTIFYHRLNDGEPRTDLIGKDYKVALDSDQIRMFARSVTMRGRGGPGYGSMLSMPSVYYSSIFTHQPMSPVNAMGMMRRSLDLDPLGSDFADGIRVRLNRDPKANEYFFWIERYVEEDDDIEPELQEKLGEGWSPAEPPTKWMIYDHWTWRKIYRLERHHWKKAATTQPATTKPR